MPLVVIAGGVLLVVVVVVVEVLRSGSALCCWKVRSVIKFLELAAGWVPSSSASFSGISS